MEAIVKATGVKYRHVTYDGGNPAVIATVGGETQVTTQLASEQAEMIKGKRLRPLAVVGAKPLEIEGFGTIPPITNWVKNVPSVDTAFGIAIPKGVPAEVVATVEKVWNERIFEVGKAQGVRQGALGAVLADGGQGGLRRGLADGDHRFLDHQRRGHGEGLAREAGLSTAVKAGSDRTTSARAGLRWERRCWSASWRMDRLEGLNINPWSVPGLLPGLLGALMMLFGAALFLRGPGASDGGGRPARGRTWLALAFASVLPRDCSDTACRSGLRRRVLCSSPSSAFAGSTGRPRRRVLGRLALESAAIAMCRQRRDQPAVPGSVPGPAALGDGRPGTSRAFAARACSARCRSSTRWGRRWSAS